MPTTKRKFTDSLKRKFGSSIRPLTPAETDQISLTDLEDILPEKDNRVKSRCESDDRIEENNPGKEMNWDTRSCEAGSRGECAGGGGGIERSISEYVQMDRSASTRIPPKRNLSEHMGHFLDKDYRDESYLDMNEMQVSVINITTRITSVINILEASLSVCFDPG